MPNSILMYQCLECADSGSRDSSVVLRFGSPTSDDVCPSCGSDDMDIIDPRYLESLNEAEHDASHGR